MARKIWTLRILADEQSASDVDAPVLVVSQFTLYGDARKGRRPTWEAAAPGPVSEPLYDAVCAALADLGAHVERGVFGAQMRVSSVNDGPFTVLLERWTLRPCVSRTGATAVERRSELAREPPTRSADRGC